MNKDIITPSSENLRIHKLDTKCAPGLTFDGISCIKVHILAEMARAYNKEVGASNSSAILLDQNLETLNPRKYKKYLVNEFTKRFGDKCKTQKCWTEQSFVENMKKIAKDDLEKFVFRPDGPEGKFEWLNTVNIVEVLEQYEKNDKNFKFLGAVPIDFDRFERFGIKNLNYKKLVDQDIYKIGVIFNLDEHDQPGSHWVALYSNLKEGKVYFFDSYGTPPERRIRALMRRLAEFSKTALGVKNIIVDHNKIRHQYKGSECGVYSVNFIIRMLKGQTFEEICNSKVPDDVVNKCRIVYFGNIDIDTDVKKEICLP